MKNMEVSGMNFFNSCVYIGNEFLRILSSMELLCMVVVGFIGDETFENGATVVLGAEDVAFARILLALNS